MAGDGFAEAVLEIVRSIPPGRVMSYGDIAAELGTRGARLVGRVMATSGEGVPWWRVVRSDGRPPRGHEADAWARYANEGTAVTGDIEGYRVRMPVARWRPQRTRS